MKYIRICFLLFFTALSLNAHSIVLNFDDHPNATQNSFGAIGTYGGFNFVGSNSYNRMDWIDTVDSSWNYGAASGEFTMLNNYGGSAIITAADNSEFTFTGLYTRMWGSYNSTYEGITGYLDGAEVFDIDVDLTTAWEYVAGNSFQIDELRLNLGYYFLVDDLELNGNVSSIPEPGSLALLALGLLALRFKSKQYG